LQTSLGLSQLALGDSVQAMENLEKAVKLGKNISQPDIVLGMVRLKEGNLKATLACPSPLKLGHYFSTGKGLDMARKRHSDEDILKLLREIEVKLSAGSDVASACRGVGISDATYYNWRKRFGGMGRSQLSEMRSLEKENARLKKIVAELELDKLILKESLSHLKPRA